VSLILLFRRVATCHRERKTYRLLLRLCIDNRDINEVTRKDANPLPRVDDIVDELKDANFYSHIDLAFGFLQVRVRDEDVHRTACHTHDSWMECRSDFAMR
jgi:hypothetical protein